MSDVPKPITIRSATASDLTFLWNMLYESAWTTDAARAAWRADPQPPRELRKYLDGWGRAGDAGVVAESSDGECAGAAWYRLFAAADRGDGIFAEPNVPELAIAVEPHFRGRGIGAALLAALIRRAGDDSYQRMMLSVDPENARARRLYDRLGFTLIDTDDPAAGTSLMMEIAL
jgi:ribosomal protein S18 acetylase RimI-like enzyme